MSDDIQRPAFKAGSNVSAGTLNKMANASLRARGLNGVSVRYSPEGRMFIEAIGSSLPPGFGMDYFGIIDLADPWGRYPVPRGWLIRNGAEVTRTGYPRLFAAIGTTFGAGDGLNTFNLPNDQGRVTVGAKDPAGELAPMDYDLGDTGGYNWHGQTENNHPDHSADIDLDHIHDVPMDSQTICDGPPDGGGCLYGSKTVADYTSNINTGDPDSWGTADSVPAGGSNDANQGSITKDGNKVTITLKHGGYENLEDNTGAFEFDTDNRPPYLACWKLIKT